MTSHITSHMTSHTKTQPRIWKLHDAKARFSEFLNTALREGPQIVSRRGIAEAVLVPVAEWEGLKQVSKPDLRDFLLGPGPRFELELPSRRSYRSRPPLEFE